MSEKLKLSALIRQGAKLRPQTRRSYYRVTTDGLTSCALGAAAEAHRPDLATRAAAGRHVAMDVQLALDEVMGGAIFDMETPPALLARYDVLQNERHLGGFIVQLNDALELTREQIADELEAVGL